MKSLWQKLSSSRSVEDSMLTRVQDKVPGVKHIIEAGAHSGSDSVRLSKAFPRAIIHSFECHPKMYDKLEQSAAKRRNIKTYRNALGSENGRVPFNLSSGGSDASSSLLRPDQHLTVHPQIKFEETVLVDSITIDRWLEVNSDVRLDFAWLDLQGAEQAVLSASPKALTQLRAIYTEVSFKQMYVGAPLFKEYRQFLEAAGFSLELEDRRWEDMGNALFVKS
jgi:FkbM family methyltransferase